MAENRAVWGIDIGQAGLKAIRLRYAEAAGQVLAVAFDYVPHPKLLSQPDAIPEELIQQALEKFLSRNDIGGDAVAISVPGQSALTRFIQLPPVESGKVSEIVKYEARQQIPFALEEVIWDYQVLAGGKEESGYLLGAEVGLFAMKRDQVAQYLRPFKEAKVEIDLIQIAPLALYNVLVYDQLGYRPGRELPRTDEFTIVLDMGADNTTLLVSNGQKVWIRNVPIGGNNFTRALTKEMKLTFAKAEHLKCNATKSDDPRAVFQALRPVFNDYVSEIQRSIGYFSSVNREAKISKVLGFGNGFKLAGLQKFLQQNLQYPVERAESFKSVVGDNVLSAALFEENVLSFAVPYGLALQLLELTPIHTSLLPPEIVTARKIRRKKPYAVAAAAALLLGMSVSAFGFARVWQSVNEERFGEEISQADALKSKVQGDESNYNSAVSRYSELIEAQHRLLAPLEARDYWPALYKAINVCVPRDRGDVEQIPIEERNRLKITSMRVEQVADLSTWFNSPPVQAQKMTMHPDDRNRAPSGSGFVVTLTGVHYHSNSRRGFVKDTLLKNLHEWSVAPDGPEFPVRQLGITHAVLIRDALGRRVPYSPKRGLLLAGGNGFEGGYGGDEGGFGDMESMYGREGYEAAGEGAEFGGEGLGYGMTPGEGGYGYNAGGTGMRRGPSLPGLPVPSRELLEQAEAEEDEVREITQTTFLVQFVWRPVPAPRREVFGLLHRLFEENPNATLSDAQAIAQTEGLAVTQEDFDAYNALFASGSSEQGPL